MTHLLILCEGHVEKRVLKEFLRVYWSQRFKTVEVQNYSGNKELSKNFKADAEQQLTQELTSSVLCLVDLYEEPFGLYQSDISLEENFQRVQERMYRQIDFRLQSRFGAFPVVMEIETWLLADPEIQKHLNQSINFPEAIEHPARRLEEIYEARNSKYGKVADGLSLFQRASAKRVFDDNCSHFKQLIAWLTHPPKKKKQKISHKLEIWESERNQKYAHCLALEEAVQTDADLDAAIASWDAYNAFLQTYEPLFKR